MDHQLTDGRVHRPGTHQATRVLLALALLLTLGAVACGRPYPGERPGPDRPTVGPTFERFSSDVARTVIFGAKLLNADGDPIPGRVSVFLDAADARGRGVAAGKFPVDTEVDSGWEYMIQVARDHPHAVIFAMRVTAVGLDHGEQVECYIQDGDPPFGFYDHRRNRVPHDSPNPAAPRRANCATTLLPIQQ